MTGLMCTSKEAVAAPAVCRESKFWNEPALPSMKEEKKMAVLWLGYSQ